MIINVELINKQTNRYLNIMCNISSATIITRGFPKKRKTAHTIYKYLATNLDEHNPSLCI